MGWASGSSLFSLIIEIAKLHIPDEKTREDIYVDLIEAFRNKDWDTMDECLGEDPAYDAAYFWLFPENDVDFKADF